MTVVGTTTGGTVGAVGAKTWAERDTIGVVLGGFIQVPGGKGGLQPAGQKRKEPSEHDVTPQKITSMRQSNYG